MHEGSAGGRELAQLVVALQAREAARADRPDAADRHVQRRADVPVVDGGVGRDEGHEPALTVGQRRQRAVEHVAPLTLQQRVLGRVVVDRRMQVVGDDLAHVRLQQAQRLATDRRRQPAGDRVVVANAVDVLVELDPGRLDGVVGVLGGESVGPRDGAQHAIEAVDEPAPGEVVAGAGGADEAVQIGGGGGWHGGQLL